MKTTEYINANNIGASGSLGISEMQVKWGTQFVPVGRFSVQGNREFDTLANATNYIYTSKSAFPGIIITISNDGSNNGAYLVENDHNNVSTNNPNGLKLTKLAQGGEAEINWDVITDEEEGGVEGGGENV